MPAILVAWVAQVGGWLKRVAKTLAPDAPPKHIEAAVYFERTPYRRDVSGTRLWPRLRAAPFGTARLAAA